MRTYVAMVVLASSMFLSAPALAQPALPPGMDLQSLVGGTHVVPGGQTTTVDLGYPVQANYSGGGWTVVSSGSAVTVTAPASGTVTVPFTAGGQSATITLVAEEGAAPIEVPPAEELQELVNPGAGNSNGAAGTAGGGTATPDAQSSTQTPGATGTGSQNSGSSTQVDRSEAEQIHLNATIEGNRLVAKLSLSQAANLYSKFGNVSTDGMKLRYLDVNGVELKGIKRDIDKASRTLTLTFPEGKQPDNPLVMEASRDGKAIAIATLTDPNVAQVTPTNPAESPSQPATVSTDSNNTKKYGLIAVGGVLVLLVLVGLVTTLLRGGSSKKAGRG